MRFANPEILYFIWGIVPLAIFFVWTERRRKAILGRIVSPALTDQLAASYSLRNVRWKNILWLLVYVFSILALSRPQSGFEWQQIRPKGVDILFVVDTSKSMLAQDIKPNRLERTKLAIKDFLKKLQGDRVGLLAFSGEAFWVCPLTADYDGFLLSLEDLNTAIIPRGGTNIAAAIRESLKGYDNTPSKYKVVIVFTDGDNLEGDPLEWAKKAKEKGFRIFTVGIGTAEGELIRTTDEPGGTQFVKDRSGNFVKSRLNEDLLQQIALTSQGLYSRASGADFGLDLIYDQEISKMAKREFEQKMEKRYFERFQIPLTFAVLCLLVSTMIPTRKDKE